MSTPSSELEALRAQIIANAKAAGVAAEQRALAAANKQESWAKMNLKPLLIGHASMGAIWALVHFVL